MKFAENRPCKIYWGTHGCELEYGHSGYHYCGDAAGPCSEFDSTASMVRGWDDATREWMNWMPTTAITMDPS